MGLLKKVVFALFMSSAMVVTAPTAMAGKVANQTAAETATALDDTVTVAEEALEAIKNGTDKKTTMNLLKKTKQTAKTIESSTVLALRDRALAKVNKARFAYKKDNLEKAEAIMTKAVAALKNVRAKYHAF